MRRTYFMLAAVLLFAMAGTSMAQMSDQMDQQTDQQAMAQQSMTATVQMGPVVRAGLPASADVFVDGRFAMRIAAPAGGLTPMQRAQLIAERLNRAFAAGMSWQDTRVSQVGGLWAVTIDSMLIATADQRSARAFGTSTGNLANRWARQTVLAMGGQPLMIAQQLQPVPGRVAGARAEIGAVNWATSPTKTVPLLNAATGDNLGNVMVAGPRAQLDMVNAVALYEHSADGAIVRTFVPIAGSRIAGQLRRVPGVGLVSIPSGTVPMAGFGMGAEVMRMTMQMGSRWNSLINSRLTQQQLQARADTKVVPLYSMDSNQVIGAAQVVGTSRGIAQTQMVSVSTRDNMMRFMASSAQCPPMGEPTALNNVVVSALIFIPQESMSPATSQPGMMQPGATGTPAPEEEETTGAESTPSDTEADEAQPGY